MAFHAAKGARYLCWIPGDYFGGCEAYGLRIARRARAKGLNVTVVCLAEACEKAIREAECGLRVIRLSFRQNARRFPAEYTITSIGKALSYARCLLSERPDVAHAVLPWHAHSAAWISACTMLRIPLLITFQLVGPECPPGWRHINAFRIAKRHGARLCAVSEQNRRLLCEYYGFERDEVTVVRNSPETARGPSLGPEQRRKLKHELGLPGDAPMILTVAGLREQKGHDLIIAAIDNIAEEYPHAMFVWAGEGERKRHLEQLALQRRVESKIIMLGHRTDVATLLGAADAFLFSSRREGESFALCEAASAGVPIVSSDASGIRDLLRDGEDAYLFRCGDAESLASAVKAALADPAEAMHRALSAKRRVSSYTEEEMFRATFEILEDLSKNGRRVK